MLKEISSVFSFLTIIPSNNTNLETVARYMHIFPIIGIAIGLLVGSIGFGLSFFLEPLIVSLLVVASLAIITGIHHTDGLADFADGLMTRGTKEKKRKAMIAPTTYNTTETIPAEPVERSFIALHFFSFVPLVIRPSAKSANPSV